MKACDAHAADNRRTERVAALTTAVIGRFLSTRISFDSGAGALLHSHTDRPASRVDKTEGILTEMRKDGYVKP